jgi:hypothetical protein
VRLTGIILIAAVSSAALTGCALRDPRDDYGYGSGSDGLWNSNWELIDWNFPTSVTQGPIEAPKRITLERTAIGVTWATRNPLPLNDQLPAQDAPSAASSEAPPPAASSVSEAAKPRAWGDHQSADDAMSAPAAASTPGDARAAARERGGVR